jgi:hypothetical protein
MASDFSALPQPAPLARAATIEFQWGEQHFELWATACSLRTLPWPETGELVSWLHCKGMRVAEIKSDEPTGLMNLLIPAGYVTVIKPGPTFRLGRWGMSGDIGIFPPIHPAPANALPLAELELGIMELLQPERN